MLVEGTVGNLDGVLDAVAEAEMAGNLEPDRPKVEHGRLQVALARIHDPAGLFHRRDDGALVESRDVELPGHAGGG